MFVLSSQARDDWKIIACVGNFFSYALPLVAVDFLVILNNLYYFAVNQCYLVLRNVFS